MKNKRNYLFGRRTVSNLLVVIAGILFYLLLANFPLVKSGFKTFMNIFKPFIIGLGFAYLLNMPMAFFERTVFKKYKRKRALSILVTYASFILILAVLLWLVIPEIGNTIGILINSVSYYTSNLDSMVEDIANLFNMDPAKLGFISTKAEEIISTVLETASGLIPKVANIAISVGSSIISALTAVIASIYMLTGKEKLLSQLEKVIFVIFPQKASKEIFRIGKLSNKVFSGFISGKLIDSAIIGAICFVFMLILVLFKVVNIQIAALISIIIGVTNIIPFFGPFIGAIPASLILLMVSPLSCLIFILFIILLQQFDGNILGPKILGDSTGLPALWVLVAIIVGGGFFGFAGMILGVPAAAVIYNISGDILNRRHAKKLKALEQAKIAENEKTDENEIPVNE